MADGKTTPNGVFSGGGQLKHPFPNLLIETEHLQPIIMARIKDAANKARKIVKQTAMGKLGEHAIQLVNRLGCILDIISIFRIAII